MAGILREEWVRICRLVSYPAQWNMSMHPFCKSDLYIKCHIYIWTLHKTPAVQINPFIQSLNCLSYRVVIMMKPIVRSHTHLQFTVLHLHVLHICELWMKPDHPETTQIETERTCKLQTKRPHGLACTWTRDLLAVRWQCNILSHRAMVISLQHHNR